MNHSLRWFGVEETISLDENCEYFLKTYIIVENTHLYVRAYKMCEREDSRKKRKYRHTSTEEKFDFVCVPIAQTQ